MNRSRPDATCRASRSARPGLVDRHPALGQRRPLDRVDLDPEHLVAELGHGGRVGGPEVAAPDDRDPHGRQSRVGASVGRSGTAPAGRQRPGCPARSRAWRPARRRRPRHRSGGPRAPAATSSSYRPRTDSCPAHSTTWSASTTHRLAVDQEVQAVVVDPDVRRAAHLADPRLLEHGAVRPAAGLARGRCRSGWSCAGPASPRAPGVRGFGSVSPPGWTRRVADAPVRHPVVEVVRRGRG